MIVVGVDPGGVWTGLAVVGLGGPRSAMDTRSLIASTTVERRPVDDPLDVPGDYLEDVVAAVSAAVREHDADLIAVEGLSKPNAHHRGKLKPVDPTAIMLLAATYGAIASRVYYGPDGGSVPIVRVPPGGMGSRPLEAYPEQLRPTRGLGRGKDRLRHERSAFDVALAGPAVYRLELARRARR